MFNRIPMEFVRRFGPPFGVFHSTNDDSDSSASNYMSDDDDQNNQMIQKEDWPTYTTEELLKLLKDMKSRVKQQASYRIEPCKTIVNSLIEMYKTISNGKEWTFGLPEDDTFKIEPSDDEVIVNYKVCMMAAEAIPNALMMGINQATTRGFLKHIYCLDSTLGTIMLSLVANPKIHQFTQSLYFTQSMKIPDWKISIFTACLKISDAGLPILQNALLVRQFKLNIACYYNSSNWEGVYIDMNDMDCMLLDYVYKSDSSEEQMTRSGKTAYQQFDNPKIPSIQVAFQNMTPFYHIYPEILYDISVVEKESIKIIPIEDKYRRVRKIISFFKLFDQKNDSHGVTESISNFLTRILKISHEEIKFDCLNALASANNNNRNFNRCKTIIESLLPLLDTESTRIREEAYRCCAKYLNFDYGYSSQLMHKILNSFSLNPIPKTNYLQMFTAAFRYSCADPTFSEKSLNIIQKVAECIKEQDYFLEVAESIQTILMLPSLPSVFAETLTLPLDDIVDCQINSNVQDSKSIEIIEKVQNLVESVLKSELAKYFFRNIENITNGLSQVERANKYEERLIEISKHFHIPKMLKFLVEKDRELSPVIVSFFFDARYFKDIRIHPEIGNEEFIAKSLAKSKSKEAHTTLGRILNKHFIATGTSILSPEEIDALVNEKLECPQIHEQENQKFIYSVAHFGDFSRIANAIGQFGCPYGFLYEGDTDPSSDLILTNFLLILEHNLNVRPKLLEVDEIADALSDCITMSESRSVYLTSLLQRVTLLLDVFMNSNNMEDETSEDEDDEDYDSDSSYDFMGARYNMYPYFDDYDFDEEEDDDDDSDD